MIPEENKKVIIDGKERVPSATRNMSFWHECLGTEGWWGNTKDFGVNFKFDIVSLTVDGTHSVVFSNPKEVDEYYSALFEVFGSYEKIKELSLVYETFAKNLFSSLEKCNKKLTKQTLADFFADYRVFTAGLTITTYYGRCGSDALTERLTQIGVSEKDVPQITSTITYPSTHTPSFVSQLDLLKIGEKIQEKEITLAQSKTLLEKWVREHGAIPVNYCDEPWTLKDAEAQLKEAMSGDCSKAIKESISAHKTKVKDAKETLKKINDAKVSLLAYSLAECTTINESRKNVFCKVSLGFRPIFAKIAKLAGSSNWRDCFYLTPDEMFDLLEGKEVLLEKIIKERKYSGLCLGKNGKYEILDAKSTRLLVESMNAAQRNKSNEETTSNVINGFTANKGMAKGLVKVVLSSKEFKKFLHGDILVATMTSVDFVPIMAKAAAFVTNEGGITSHASIVAREMDKPCIIGTKNATKLLHDGDLVEVDANNGVVRILKRHSGKG